MNYPAHLHNHATPLLLSEAATWDHGVCFCPCVIYQIVGNTLRSLMEQVHLFFKGSRSYAVEFHHTGAFNSALHYSSEVWFSNLGPTKSSEPPRPLVAMSEESQQPRVHNSVWLPHLSRVKALCYAANWPLGWYLVSLNSRTHSIVQDLPVQMLFWWFRMQAIMHRALINRCADNSIDWRGRLAFSDLQLNHH